MTQELDSENFDLDCPHCHGKLKMRDSKLRRGEAKCPKCGAQIDASNFRRKLGEADRQIRNFEKEIGDMDITL